MGQKNTTNVSGGASYSAFGAKVEANASHNREHDKGASGVVERKTLSGEMRVIYSTDQCIAIEKHGKVEFQYRQGKPGPWTGKPDGRLEKIIFETFGHPTNPEILLENNETKKFRDVIVPENEDTLPRLAQAYRNIRDHGGHGGL